MTDNFNKHLTLANCLLSAAAALVYLSNAIWQWQPEADRLVSAAAVVAASFMARSMYQHWKRS